MEEEEEDRILLSTLGVTSANPVDIERDLIKKVVFVYLMLFSHLKWLIFSSCVLTMMPMLPVVCPNYGI